MNRALEPLGECRSDLDIISGVAERLGIEGFNPRSEEEWIKFFVETNPDYQQYIDDYEEFRKSGIHRIKLSEPFVAFKEQVDDIDKNPFPTPSGKIEIYSKRVADLNNPLCPPIPKYLMTREDHNDPLSIKYPLQLITPHPKNRVHSEMYLVPWLREVEEHRAWINPADAGPRGVKDGDEIHVFNDRGKVAIKARVTGRIMPGVISIFEGAWYDPDKEGIDRGGCANTLTRDEYSGGGAAVLNTSLVQVEKSSP
jgi:anaerobic dimethyl sulfoxide reductase subunit A